MIKKFYSIIIYSDKKMEIYTPNTLMKTVELKKIVKRLLYNKQFVNNVKHDNYQNQM